MPERVTIRLIPEKEHVYDEFKEIVIDRLHSDVCYVMTELMESFILAIKQLPEPRPITLQFLKQNVQINMGCTFHYNTRHAKRLPTDRQLLEVQRNQILPNLIDMWTTLRPESKAYWTKALTESGITPPTNRDICHTSLQQPKCFMRWLRRKLHWKHHV